jgi:hypothetical protein
VIDSNGIIYISGYTYSFGHGDSDLLVLKYDSDGSLKWDLEWGGAKGDSGVGIALDGTSSIYITGLTRSFSSGITGKELLLKIDDMKFETWYAVWGGEISDDMGNSVAVDISGNVYVTGETKSYGAGKSDVSLLKYDTDGLMLWNKTWGTAELEIGQDMLSYDGKIYITGKGWNIDHNSYDCFFLKCDENGGPKIPELQMWLVPIASCALALCTVLVLTRMGRKTRCSGLEKE